MSERRGHDQQVTFWDGPADWWGPEEDDSPGFAAWGEDDDDGRDVLCERCGWSGTGIESEAVVDAAIDAHRSSGQCRVR